mgnify:CR=1 FL=1
MKVYRDKRNGDIYESVDGVTYEITLTDALLSKMENGVRFLYRAKDNKLVVVERGEFDLFESIDDETINNNVTEETDNPRRLNKGFMGSSKKCFWCRKR